MKLSELMTYNHNLKIDSNDISFSSAYERDYMLVSDDEKNVIAIDITSDEVKDKMIENINRAKSDKSKQRDILYSLWQLYLLYESRSLDRMIEIPEEEFNRELSKLERVYDVIDDFKKTIKENDNE